MTEEELTSQWAPDAPNPATMRVATAAADLDVDAMVVPSAAHPGGWNLAVLPRAFDRVRLAARRREVPRPPAAPAS
ncbi:MAG TPA: RES family NAD+ phosphorylase [Candidatus Limnocylindria bacterium]|nr:RES family NAD+ phosphorylase [Candidatus Limnocylindria bacterium]